MAMKITIKKLQGGECNVEVLPTTLVSEIKRKVSERLDVPVENQKLLLLGRTLIDEQSVQSYPSIKDGTKLNLVVKKPEGLFEVAVKHFKKLGMSESEATATAHRWLKIIEEKFYKLSWDDVDRLSYDILLDEHGENPPVEQDHDCEGQYGL